MLDRSSNVVDSIPCWHRSFAIFCTNRLVSDCVKNANKSPKTPIPQCWGKWTGDSESVSGTKSPPKVNQFFWLVVPVIYQVSVDARKNSCKRRQCLPPPFPVPPFPFVRSSPALSSLFFAPALSTLPFLLCCGANPFNTAIGSVRVLHAQPVAARVEPRPQSQCGWLYFETRNVSFCANQIL